MSSCTNLLYQVPSTEKIWQAVLTDPGKEIQIDFSVNLHSKDVTGEPHIHIGIERCSKRPVVRICKSTGTKEIINFAKGSLTFTVSLSKKLDRSSAFISKEYKIFCKNKNIEIEYSPPRLHTGTRVVVCAIQTLKSLIIANWEDKIGLTESINRALWVMRFLIHTRLKVSPFEFYHGRKPKRWSIRLAKLYRNKSTDICKEISYHIRRGTSFLQITVNKYGLEAKLTVQKFLIKKFTGKMFTWLRQIGIPEDIRKKWFS